LYSDKNKKYHFGKCKSQKFGHWKGDLIKLDKCIQKETRFIYGFDIVVDLIKFVLVTIIKNK